MYGQHDLVSGVLGCSSNSGMDGMGKNIEMVSITQSERRRIDYKPLRCNNMAGVRRVQTRRTLCGMDAVSYISMRNRTTDNSNYESHQNVSGRGAIGAPSIFLRNIHMGSNE